MAKKLLVFAMILSIALLSGCASGPSYTQMQSKIPTLMSDTGRIFFYRTANPFGFAIQPDIVLNGEVIGSSVPGGFFFVDIPPGDCKVSCSTETEHKLTFQLNAGKTRYVRTEISAGLFVARIQPQLVDLKVGEEEIKDLSYQVDE